MAIKKTEKPAYSAKKIKGLAEKAIDAALEASKLKAAIKKKVAKDFVAKFLSSQMLRMVNAWHLNGRTEKEIKHQIILSAEANALKAKK